MTGSKITEGAEEAPMPDILERLRKSIEAGDMPFYRDEDGKMVFHSDNMEEAATEIATLRQQLVGANEIINAAIDDYNNVREILAAAFDEWESQNGRLTDENDPHWTNDARRALAAGRED